MLNKEMAVILLESLLDRIDRDGGTGTVSRHEVLALRYALNVLNPDTATTTGPSQPTAKELIPEKPPTKGVQPPKPIGEGPEFHAIELVLDSLKQTEPSDSDIILCLDFGTAMSKAFASVLPNEYLDLELGTAAGRSGYTLPSSVFIADNGKAYFGYEAIEQSQGLIGSGRQRLDSIKAWLSQQSEGSLDGEARVLHESWNPTKIKLTQGDMIRIYLAYLTDMSNKALAVYEVNGKTVSRYVKRRFARPCWPDAAQTAWADKLMRVMLAEAQILADTFSKDWSGGIELTKLKAALEKVRKLTRRPDYLIGDGIPEPVAVAAGAIDSANNIRDAFMVVDVGAGTTDFGLFVSTRNPNDEDEKPKVFQIPASIHGLMQAGDKVDGMLRAFICKHESVDTTDISGQLIQADLGRRIRSLKETFFRTGSLEYALADSTVGKIALKDFLEDPTVKRFGQLVEEGFKTSLQAVDDTWLRWLAMSGVHLHVVLTGGSSALPMMQALSKGPIEVKGFKIMRQAVDPKPNWMENVPDELLAVYPQLAVAIGGAAEELPETLTAPLSFAGGTGKAQYTAGRLHISGR
jgi:molecular chaperone HscA